MLVAAVEEAMRGSVKGPSVFAATHMDELGRLLVRLVGMRARLAGGRVAVGGPQGDVVVDGPG